MNDGKYDLRFFKLKGDTMRLNKERCLVGEDGITLRDHAGLKEIFGVKGGSEETAIIVMGEPVSAPPPPQGTTSGARKRHKAADNTDDDEAFGFDRIKLFVEAATKHPGNQAYNSTSLVHAPSSKWPLGDADAPLAMYFRPVYISLLEDLRREAANPKGFVWVLGSQGVGKTSLMNLLLLQFLAEGRKVLVQQTIKIIKTEPFTRFWWWDGSDAGHTTQAVRAADFLLTQSGMVVIVDGGPPTQLVTYNAREQHLPIVCSVSPRIGMPLFPSSNSFKATRLWVPPWSEEDVESYVELRAAPQQVQQGTGHQQHGAISAAAGQQLQQQQQGATTAAAGQQLQQLQQGTGEQQQRQQQGATSAAPGPQLQTVVPAAAEKEEALKRFALVGGVARFIFGEQSYDDLNEQMKEAFKSCSATVLKEVEATLHGQHWPPTGERLILLDYDAVDKKGYPRFCSTAAMVAFMAARSRQDRLEIVRFVAAGRQFHELGVVRGHKWEDLFYTCTIAGFTGQIRKLKPRGQRNVEVSVPFEHKPCSPTMFSSLAELSTYVRQHQQQHQQHQQQ